MNDDDLPASIWFDADTERRILALMQYGFWTGAAGVALAVLGAAVLYTITTWGALVTAGCAVGFSLIVMLSVRLLRLHGLRGATWQEWTFIALSAGVIVGLTGILEWLLP